MAGAGRVLTRLIAVRLDDVIRSSGGLGDSYSDKAGQQHVVKRLALEFVAPERL